MSTVFVRTRASSKVGVEYDQEGKEIVVETREDEEQQAKFVEIIDLLVAAGYFRARIKGLSSFDKVVGGMTWCVSNCSFDIDVDLLFQENSTIGQKISLTEKIVSVLPRMKCPHAIEPHQIQGLDFKSIFPVIQWLVKKVIETREETGDHIRAYSISQFSKHYKMPQDIAQKEQDLLMHDAIGTLRSIYRPLRKYRRSDKQSLTTEEALVASTLLEYGQRAAVRKKATQNEGEEDGQETSDRPAKESSITEEIVAGFSKISVRDQKVSAEDEEEDIRIAQEKTIQALMGEMSEISGREIEGKLASKVIGSIVEMQSNEIQQISSIFAQKKEDITEALANKPPTVAQQHQKVVARLQEKISVKTEASKEVQAQYENVEKEKTELQKRLTEAKSQKESVKEEMKELEEIEINADGETLQKLKDLIALNENLKQQESQFKRQCKEEATSMNEKIEELQQELNDRSSVEDSNNSLVEKQWKEDSEKLAKIRLLLAAKNRQVASLTRKIDEVPTRAELTQYQKRFVELYEQVRIQKSIVFQRIVFKLRSEFGLLLSQNRINKKMCFKVLKNLSRQILFCRSVTI